MAFDPKTYQDGFTAGWLAAFRVDSACDGCQRSRASAWSATKSGSGGAARQTPERKAA